jgi:hypothetical protein
MYDDTKPGVCFGFSLTVRNSNDYKLELVFNDKQEEGDAQMIPSQLEEVASPYSTD